MKFNDIIQVIERIAPLAVAAEWDMSGVQVASTKEEISCLAVCLDPTPCSLQKALDYGAEMILSHHPLVLKPRLPAELDYYHRSLTLLLSANVSLYAAHTSLDANLDGPASWLAEALNLCEYRVLEPVNAEGTFGTYGFGRIGQLSSAMTIDELQKLLKPWVKTSVTRLVGILPQQIHQVAFCPGAGAAYAVHAANQNADVFITGDVRYHQALELSLPIIDVGHFCLEEEMMHRMAKYLQNILSGVTVIFISAHDPFHPFYTTH